MPLPLAHAVASIARPGRLLWRHLRYGPASFASAASPRKAAALTALFHEVNGWLQRLGAGHALAFGTLLGWHRDGGLLPHDRDLDFMVPATAFAIIREARAQLPRGFALHDTSHRHGGPKLYISHRGWEADLYFYVEEQARLRLFLRSDLPGDTTPFPREFLLPLRPAVFLGEPTWVPAQPEPLLRHHYGYLGPDAVLDPVTRYYRPRSPAPRNGAE